MSQESMDDALAKLPPAQQRLFLTRMTPALRGEGPLTSRACAEVLGIAEGTVASGWYKIRSKLGYDPLLPWKEVGKFGANGSEDFERLRNVAPDTIIKLAEMRLEAIFRAMSPEKIGESSLAELARASEAITKQRALLKGEPTQILQVNQRDKLHDLLPLIQRELLRRGMDMDPTTGAPRRLGTGDVIDGEIVQ